MWDRDLPQEVEPLQVYAGDHVVQEYFIEQMEEVDGELVLVGPFDFYGWLLTSQWRGGARQAELDVTNPEAGVLRLTLDKTTTRE